MACIKVPTKYRNKLTRGIIYILNVALDDHVFECVDKVNDKFDSFLYDLKGKCKGPVEFKTSDIGTFELRRSGKYVNRIRDYSKNLYLICVSFKTRYIYIVPTDMVKGKCSISESRLIKEKCIKFKLPFSILETLLYIGCYPMKLKDIYSQ